MTTKRRRQRRLLRWRRRCKRQCGDMNFAFIWKMFCSFTNWDDNWRLELGWKVALCGYVFYISRASINWQTIISLNCYALPWTSNHNNKFASNNSEIFRSLPLLSLVHTHCSNARFICWRLLCSNPGLFFVFFLNTVTKILFRLFPHQISKKMTYYIDTKILYQWLRSYVFSIV